MIEPTTDAPALWGGIECTIARMRGRWRDQVSETGHRDRLADLDAIAGLGIRTLRYPVLWEAVSPDTPDASDFRWHDERLDRLRQLGVEVIAGLVHHGSGPRYTNLLDPVFPALLAAHAARVAERYPWIRAFTPVNEPLTTARFSCLYGHWYPHRKDMGATLRALVIQAKATVLAMRAIRRVTPGARLVQTEDLGKTFSRPALSDQADFENARRWLTFDLLTGAVDRHHPFWPWFLGSGVPEAELDFFLDRPAAPDVIGVNHYLTSERYLDERTRLYPPEWRGGNGRQRYADVEAVRIDGLDGPTGPEARLREVWGRYRIPVAVTEAHLGCSREEQLRWFMSVWNAAVKLRAEGADIRAVTAWSLLGVVDWNSLLTRSEGHYEPGAFDVRSTPPRPTALAGVIGALARGADAAHPVLQAPGWWERPARFYRGNGKARERRCRSAHPLLITGATGTLGRAFARISAGRGLDHVLTSRQDLDIADPASVAAALGRHRPWAVVNGAGFARPADEASTARCFRENATGPAVLAEACREAGIPFVTFSSDLVFAGDAERGYVESDAAAPICVYGRSKAEAEQEVLSLYPGALVVRTSAFFGPWDRYNFVHNILSDLAAGRPATACERTVVSPSYVPDLVHAALDLLIDGEDGIWHLANEGAISWFDLAEAAARQAGLETALLERADGGIPRWTALASERGRLMPALDGALRRFLRETEIDWRVLSAATDAA